MSKHMSFHLFRYTKYYHKLQAQEFVLDLLNDKAVQEVLQVPGVGKGQIGEGPEGGGG